MEDRARGGGFHCSSGTRANDATRANDRCWAMPACFLDVSRALLNPVLEMRRSQSGERRLRTLVTTQGSGILSGFLFAESSLSGRMGGKSRHHFVEKRLSIVVESVHDDGLYWRHFA